MSQIVFSGSGKTFCHQLEEFKFLRVLNDGKTEQEIDWLIGAGSKVPVCCREERAESKGKGLDLQLKLLSYLHISFEFWVVTERTRLQCLGSPLDKR